MSNLDQVERIGLENRTLSKDEKTIAACLKSIAKSELKSSKIREKLGTGKN